MSEDTEVLFEALFEDDIGNKVKGKAALTIKQLIDKLNSLGYKVNEPKAL